MARITIQDLSQDAKVSREEMKRISGGLTMMRYSQPTSFRSFLSGPNPMQRIDPVAVGRLVAHSYSGGCY